MQHVEQKARQQKHDVWTHTCWNKLQQLWFGEKLFWPASQERRLLFTTTAVCVFLGKYFAVISVDSRTSSVCNKDPRRCMVGIPTPIPWKRTLHDDVGPQCTGLTHPRHMSTPYCAGYVSPSLSLVPFCTSAPAIRVFKERIQ